MKALLKALLFFSALVTLSVLLILVPDASAYKTAIIGNFEGTHNEDQIITNGNYMINNEKTQLSLSGEIIHLLSDDTIRGCKNVKGDFILSSTESEIGLEFYGKECQYGKKIFAMGSFQSIDSPDSDVVIKGRLSLMMDQESDRLNGYLFGSFIV